MANEHSMMPFQRYGEREGMAVSPAEHRVQPSNNAPIVGAVSDAYKEGSKYGVMLVEYVVPLANESADDLRAQIAALRRFRGQLSDEQWKTWVGREFSFNTKDLRLALSVVVIAFPSLLRFLKVRSYNSVEAACSVVWGAWLSPRMPRRQLVPSELLALKNADFVRGFGDAVAGLKAAEAP